MTTIAPIVDINGVAHVTSSIDDVLDYWVDWTDVLQAGETIATSSWQMTSGITAGAAAVVLSKTYTYAGPASGAGSFYLVNTIVTSAGRTYERTIIVDAVGHLS